MPRPLKKRITYIDKKTGQKRYNILLAAIDDITIDYLVEGMQLHDIWQKYRKLIDAKVSKGYLQTLLDRYNLHAARRKLNEEGALMDTSAKAKNDKVVRQKALDKQVETIIKRKKRGVDRHFNRMESQLNKVHEVLDRQKPDEEDVGPFLGNLKDFDALSRKLYDMDDNAQSDPHKINIAILLNSDQVGEKEVEAEVVS